MSEFNNINLDNPTKDIAVFNQTDAMLGDLQKQYDVVPDATTKEGYEFAKNAVSKLTKLRISIEKERKRWKKPFLDAGKMIDSEAKRITEVISGLEEPFKKAKKEEDEKIERAKQERLDNLNAKIDEMSNSVNNAIGKSSDEIREIKNSIEAIDALTGFYELTDKAVSTRSNVLSTLNQMYQQQVSFEENQRRLNELEEQAAYNPVNHETAPVSEQPSPIGFDELAPSVKPSPLNNKPIKRITFDEWWSDNSSEFKIGETFNFETLFNVAKSAYEAGKNSIR